MNEELQLAMLETHPLNFGQVMGWFAVEYGLTLTEIADWCDDLVNDDAFWEPIIEDSTTTGVVLDYLKMIKNRATGTWIARPTLRKSQLYGGLEITAP